MDGRLVSSDTTCCACLCEAVQTPHNLNEKYSEEEPELTLQIVLTELSGVNMAYEEDNLPRILCDACLDLARACYRFRKLCQESHRQLLASKLSSHDREETLEIATREDHRKRSKLKKNRSKSYANTVKKNKTNNRKPKGTTKAQERLYGEALWRPVSCSECSATVDNVPSLLAHRAARHSVRFQCLHCGAGLTTSRGLELHLRRHSGARPEVCCTCGAAFSDPRTLAIHEKRHAGTLRHVCTSCGRRFPARAPLQRHRAAHHPHHSAVAIKSTIEQRP